LYALLAEYINRRNGWLVGYLLPFLIFLLLWNRTNRSTPLDCWSHQETGNRWYQSIKLIDRHLISTTSFSLDIIILNRGWWRSTYLSNLNDIIDLYTSLNNIYYLSKSIRIQKILCSYDEPIIILNFLWLCHCVPLTQNILSTLIIRYTLELIRTDNSVDNIRCFF
jgi:hypothetical protein